MGKMKERHAHRRAQASLPFDQMSRYEAVLRVKRLLGRTPKSPTATRLIHLFHLHAEELTEAGVSYETVKTLERQCFL